MPQITLKTPINRPFAEVAARFNSDLFQALLPSIPKVEILRYDGQFAGAEIWLDMDFPLLGKERWVSIIESEERTDSVYRFIDVGHKLPFPLRRWRHVHEVAATGPAECEIRDFIAYSTGLMALDWVVRPFLALMFGGRGRGYRRFFG